MKLTDPSSAANWLQCSEASQWPANDELVYYVWCSDHGRIKTNDNQILLTAFKLTFHYFNHSPSKKSV